MAKRKTSYLSEDWGKSTRKSSGAYLSEDWGKADSKSQAQRDEETRQKRAQARIQQAEVKGWDNKEALRQRTGGVSTGPVSPMGREAAMADFYRRQAEYGAAHGNQALYDEGYEKYKATVGRIDSTAANLDRLNRFRDSVGDVARAARSPYRTLTGRTGTEDALRDLEAMGRRTERDSALYSQIAGAAAQAGSKKSYQLAEQRVKQSAGRYAQAMGDYGQAEQAERQRYMEDLRQNNRGAWYGERLSREQIEGQIRQIEGKLATIEEMQQNPNWSTGMGGTAEDKAGQTAKRYDQLRGELEQYRAALRHRNAIDKADEMRQLAESVQSGGNFRQMAEVGRAMVEDRNRQAREAVDPSLYAPDDPDDNNQFRAALDRENEALARSGYVADLDSSYIPEDVKPIYYALFAQSPAKAKEWAEYWRGIGEDEYWRQIYEESGEDAGSRLGAFIQGTFANTVAGLNPFGEGGQYAAKLGSTMIGGGAAGLTEKGLFNTGALAGEIDVPIFGKQSLGSAYQLGSSMLQSAANATLAKMTGGAAEIVGGMGTILLGSSAAAQDYQQKLEQGWDESSAKLHALAAGAAEAGFEYLSLDKLVNQDVSRGFIRNVLLQGGIEASEETWTTLANRLTDAAISALSGYDNSIQQRAKELMAFGYEAGTAEKMAQQEWMTELLNDALGGFLSGGMMTGGQYAMLPVYKAVGAVDDFKRFTGALSSTGETAITGTEELTRGKAGALAGQIGASLNTETVETARRIMGETAQNNVDGGQIARATEQNDSGDAAVNDRRYDGQNDNVERGTENPSPTEQKQSKREQRRQAREQRKQSTRDGAVYEQAVQKVLQAIDRRGVGAVNEVYAETVEQYGEAANGIAQEAITRAVSRQLSEARNVADIDRMTQAENAAPEVRAAIQQAKDLRSYQLFAQNGDTEAAERAIQSRRNSGRGSGALRLEAEYSGEDGSVKRAEITGVTANAESVKLSNGETVSVKQLANLDADTRDVLDRIAYMEVGPAADILWKGYLAEGGSGTDGYRYVMDWATAYDQGRQGSVSLKEAQGRSSLSAETVKNAYELGEQYGKDLDTKQKAELAEKMKITQKGATGRAGSVNTEQIGGMTLSEDQSKQLEIVKRLAEAFGIDVEVFASGTKEVTANGETKRQFVGENGRYQDGKIWLDINAGLNYTDDIGSGLVATMGHELTHFIQQYAPEEYRAYKRFVLATIRQQEGSQGLERLIREKIQRSKGQNLSRSAAEDEVVADAAQTVLTDSQALQLMAEQEPTLFRKVLDWIKDFFDSIREALSSSPRMSEEARLFRALEADVRKTFGELWDKGITEAVRVHDQVGSLEEKSQGQNSVRPANELYQTEFDFTEPMTTDEFRKLIKQENDAAKYFPKGLSPEFMKAITKKFFFTRPKLYRGIDASEFDFIAENGYIKSNGSYNFEDQQDQTFSDEDAGYALSYATGFAPNEISKRHYEDGQPSYLIEFINSPDLNMSKNGVQESSTYGNIDQKFITRIFEIMYDPETDNDMIQEVTNDASIRSMFPQLGKGLEGLSHGRPMFYRDKTSGTILFAVQGPDGWENGEYISEKFPGAILNYDRARENNTIRFFGVSGNEADLEPMEVDKDGNLVPAEENNGVRFSMREPVETTDRLIAVHNMTEQNLRDVLDLGGFPSPSIAVVKAANGHTQYGPISVVFGRDSIDPELDRRNKIYGADAWTPTAPRIDYPVDVKKSAALENKIEELSQKVAGGIFKSSSAIRGAGIDNETNLKARDIAEKLASQDAVRAAYLADKGKDIEPIHAPKQFDSLGNEYLQTIVDHFGETRLADIVFRIMENEPLTKSEYDELRELRAQKNFDDYPKRLKERKGEAKVWEISRERAADLRDHQLEDYARHAWEYYSDAGTTKDQVDFYATAAALREETDTKAVIEWLEPQVKPLLGKPGIYNGKDPYYPSGNRRSFASLHDEYTLGNIVRAMKTGQDERGQGIWGASATGLQAVAAPSYSTISQVKADSSRLKKVSQEDYKAIKDALDEKIEKLIDRIVGADGSFYGREVAGSLMIEGATGRKTTAAIMKLFNDKSSLKITENMAKDILGLYKEAALLPTEYFEAKPQRALGFDEIKAIIVPSNMDHEIVQGLQDRGVPVMFFEAGNDTQRVEILNSLDSAKFSERDYELPSDLELMDRAAESLSEAGGEEYWAALLEAAPELADDKAELKSMAKAYREQSRKLAEAERKLSEARQQLVTTDRKLRTKGIAGVTQEIMKSIQAGDARGRNVHQRVTQILTEAYQKALDATDEGQSPGDVWEIVYNEGIVKAADYIYQNATYSEKAGRGWNTTFISQWMQGQEGRQAVIDEVSAKVVMDWMTKRMRDPIQMTAADRIVSRVEGRMQKQIDAQTQRAESAEASNRKLREDLDFWRTAQDNAAKQVTFLGEQLEEARDDLRNTKQTDAKERRQKTARIRSLENQLKAKREEAGAWKQMASRNEQLLRAALKSKNADLEAQAQRADKAEAALAGQTVNAKAWERNADLYAKQLDKQLEQKARIVKQLEAQVQREQDILSGKLKPLAMQRLLNAARKEAAGKAKAKKEEVFQNYKERQKQSRLRSRIKNLADDMKRRMTNPTERSYVPASLYSSMTLLCDALDDLLAPNDGTKAAARYRAVMDGIHGLSAEYQAVKDLDDPTFSSEYDEEIQYEINEIIRTLQGYDEEGNPTRLFTKARELSSGELQKVYDIMKYINYCMTTAKDMMGSSQYKTVYDAMRAVAEQQRSLPRLIDEKGIRRWNRSRLLDNLSVMRGVEMMSGWDRDAALYQLMHAIENGTDESWAWVMDYNKTQQALKTGKNEKEYRDALTKKLDYNVTDEEGRKVLMTKLQALQILMTAEREAHNDKLLHLQAGGAKIRDAIDLQNGKGAQARSQTIRVTPELIQRIQESVTDWDQTYMKNVRDYFRKEGKRTNEILYRLKHRVLQTEDYYVPYKVDDNYLETKLTEQQAMNMWVKTPGSTNALKQKAKQPVIIDGMDTVMGRHVKEMGDYIGLAIPVRDFSKVYNGRLRTGEDNPLPVKKTIDDAFGKKGQHLLTQAVIDVQGGSGGQSWRSGISDFLNKLQGGFVRSALLINPSVTIKQAASYIAAESVLSHRALVLGNRATIASTDKTKSPALIAYLFANPEGKTAQRIYSEIDQHTSLHYQRRQGMSQAEIANEANRNGRVKRWMNGIGASMEQNRIGHAVRKAGENLNPVTWIQRMDVATTAALWVACKQQAKMDGLNSGTEEFWKHTTELYERVIRETQPMYDSLHRTAHQKQSGTLTQFLFPFRTVPIQNHGQLAASYEALKASRNKSKAEQKQAGKFFAKTVWAQTESAAIFALMTFIAAALKRKTKKYRDEDEELNAKSLGMGLGKDVASTLFSVLQPMYGSELVSIGSRAMDKFSGSSGYTYDAFSVGVVDMINDLISASDKLLEDAGKANRGESVSFADVSAHGLSLLLKGAKLAGIPADTVRTYWEGLVGNAKDAMEGRIPALNDESWERSAAVNAERYLKAWIAGDLNKVDRVEAEMLGNYTEAGKSEEQTGKDMKTKLTDAAKDAYNSGRLDEQDAIDFLTETGYYDEADAWNKVREWQGKLEHAGEEGYKWNQYEDLREAFASGTGIEQTIKELRDHDYTDKQLADEISDNVKALLADGSIDEDKAIGYLTQYAGKDKDKAWKTVQGWIGAMEHPEDEDYSWGQYDAIDEALAGNKDLKGLISELTAHGVKEDSITRHIKEQLVQNYVDSKTNESQLKNQLSRYLGIVAKADVDKILKDANTKKLYGVAYSSLDEEYRAGKIGKAEIKQALMKQGGLSSGEADQKIRWYDLQKANPKLDISEAVCNAWYDGTTNGSQKYGHESAKDAGMNIERYLEARKYLDTIKDANGNGTGEDEVIQALAGMRGLTAREKDALYYERYKGGTRKGIYKTW